MVIMTERRLRRKMVMNWSKRIDLGQMIRVKMLRGFGHCPGRSGHRLQGVRWKGWICEKWQHGWGGIFGRSYDGGMRPSATTAEEAGIPR
jgi:hypothetical protein